MTKELKCDLFQLLSLHKLAIWHKNNAKTFGQAKYEELHSSLIIYRYLNNKKNKEEQISIA